jgi:hypothetical protein
MKYLKYLKAKVQSIYNTVTFGNHNSPSLLGKPLKVKAILVLDSSPTVPQLHHIVQVIVTPP